MGTQMCRLCYNESENITLEEDYLEIYSLAGLLNSLDKKIQNFLNLDVDRNDEYSKDVCPVCWKELAAIGKFYERVHEIQKRYLGVSQYNSIVLKSISVRQISSISGTITAKLEHSTASPDVEPPQPMLEPRNESENYKNKVKQVEEITKVRKQTLPLPKNTQNTITEIESRRFCENQSYVDTTQIKSICLRSSRIANYHLEGDVESHSEFRRRDPSNDDLPAPEILAIFPTTILKNGKYTISKKQLTLLTSKFYKLECDMCPQEERHRFKYIKSLFIHYRDAHKIRGYVTCCNNKYGRYDRITMHMVRHVQPEPFRCEICGYMVTMPRLLKYHRTMHLPESERPIECPYQECDRRFTYYNTLRNHLISHQQPDQRIQYVCHVCGVIFDRLSAMHSHMWKTHFDRPKSRKDHRKHVQPSHNPRNIQCSVCRKMYKFNAYLWAHMKAMRGNEVYRCSRCDYHMKHKASLFINQTLAHSDKRSFECAVCGIQFKNQSVQGKHILRHIEAKKAVEVRKLNEQKKEKSRMRNIAAAEKENESVTYLDIEVLDEVALEAELAELAAIK